MLPEPINYFAQFIEKELGIIYSDFNAYQLENRLNEVVQILGLKDVQDLKNVAQGGMNANVRQLLLDTATNNETSFFRDSKIFTVISKSIFPELARKQNHVRMWSAACSAGQEPYTVSMLAQEFAQTNPLMKVELVATDISNRVLERAKAARYTQLEVQRGLPTPLLIKYFTKDEDNYWTARPEIRNRVEFQLLNLLDSFTRMGKFDVILCRNVLIYQNVEKKAQVIAKLHEALNPDGILILGAGESMIGLSEEFDSIRSEETIVYAKKGSKLLRSA